MPRGRASDDPSLQIIARNLRVIRADLKRNQGHVETEANLPKGQLSRWEKGHAKPEVDALLQLAAVYRCHVDDLLAGVHGPYDELIASGIHVDVRRHYEARLAAVRDLAEQAFKLTVQGLENAPTQARPRATAKGGHGKSEQARARRGPGKK